MLSGKKILVTGGTGFIGSHLVKRLVSEGAIVNVAANSISSHGNLKDVSSQVTIHHIDLVDREAVQELVETVSPEGVFHLAALNQSYGVIPAPADLVNVNTMSALNLLDALGDMDYDFFVQTGTSVEVGPKAVAIREDHVCEPTEFYSLSKLAATLYGQAVGKSKNKPVVTIRAFTPYGPYIQEGKLLTQLIKGALSGKEIKLSAPSVTRDFLYVDDLIDLFLLVSDRAKEFPGEIFNGGSGVATSLEELVKIVELHTNSKVPAVWSNVLASYDHLEWRADLSKVTDKLQWAPKVTLEAGVKKTVDWFKENENYKNIGE